MNTQETKNKAREIIAKWKTEDQTLNDLVDQVIDLATKQAIEEERKAFGGCTKCYGKGYSTTIDYTTAHADFIGDRTTTRKNNPVKPCSCDRGQQIINLITNRDE